MSLPAVALLTLVLLVTGSAFLSFPIFNNCSGNNLGKWNESSATTWGHRFQPEHAPAKTTRGEKQLTVAGAVPGEAGRAWRWGCILFWSIFSAWAGEITSCWVWWGQMWASASDRRMETPERFRETHTETQVRETHGQTMVEVSFQWETGNESNAIIRKNDSLYRSLNFPAFFINA